MGTKDSDNVLLEDSFWYTKNELVTSLGRRIDPLFLPGASGRHPGNPRSFLLHRRNPHTTEIWRL